VAHPPEGSHAVGKKEFVLDQAQFLCYVIGKIQSKEHRMDMVVSFPGGKRVEAQYKGFTIQTDQPEKSGGEGSAPTPFDLFLSSLGTCAGIFVLSFLQERNIPYEDVQIVMKTEQNPDTHMIDKIDIDINLTEDFPEKYKNAVKSAADLCSVKKHLMKPPAFAINVNIGCKAPL
jgi:putative redox protein